MINVALKEIHIFLINIRFVFAPVYNTIKKHILDNHGITLRVNMMYNNIVRVLRCFPIREFISKNIGFNYMVNL